MIYKINRVLSYVAQVAIFTVSMYLLALTIYAFGG